MSTINDLEANELLVRIAQLAPIVSHFVRHGQLGLALTEGSKLEDAVRKLNWRLQHLREVKT